MYHIFTFHDNEWIFYRTCKSYDEVKSKGHWLDYNRVIWDFVGV